jgi:hypothetical protein
MHIGMFRHDFERSLKSRILCLLHFSSLSFLAQAVSRQETISNVPPNFRKDNIQFRLPDIPLDLPTNTTHSHNISITDA